ncbi:MAG: SH3 domain-containing protein [Bacteroidia bacterium]
MQRIAIFSLLILLVSTSFASNEDYYPLTRFVIAKTLRMRTAPNLESSTIKLLPYGEKLTIDSTIKVQVNDTIDGIHGEWLPVIAGVDSGFVFGPYTFYELPSRPQGHTVVVEPRGYNYSNFSYSPDYFWYRLGPDPRKPSIIGLYSIKTSIFSYDQFDGFAMLTNDSLPGKIIGFAEQQIEGPIRSSFHLNEQIKTGRGIGLFPGQTIDLWNVSQPEGQEQGFQRNSFSLSIFGNVSKDDPFVAQNYTIELGQVIENQEGHSRQSYSVTPGYVVNNSGELKYELVASTEQRLRIELPTLSFAGDINRDQMPDFIVDMDWDGKRASFIIMSKQTSKGTEYEIVFTQYFFPGC